MRSWPHARTTRRRRAAACVGYVYAAVAAATADLVVGTRRNLGFRSAKRFYNTKAKPPTQIPQASA
jgi:hypothetical protein